MRVPRLELFLHASSACGQQALAQLEALRRSGRMGTVEFFVTDLDRQPEAGMALGIVFTPTLVRRELPAQPRVFGSFLESQALLSALELGEVPA
jgi:hypothetical protein